MIRRTALASLLAAALTAAAAPAIERGRVRRSNGQIESIAAAIEAAARSVAGDETVPAGRSGARRTVEIELPGRAWDEADVEALELANGSDRTLAMTYRIDGGGRRRRRIRAPVSVATADGTPIELDGDGPHEIALVLRGGDRRRIVVERVAANG